MCGLFLTGPESRSVFEEARSLEVLTPYCTDRIKRRKLFKQILTCQQIITKTSLIFGGSFKYTPLAYSGFILCPFRAMEFISFKSTLIAHSVNIKGAHSF